MSEMAGNHEAVSVLAPLLRSSEESCPKALFGAGPSFRPCLRTAADVARQTARIGEFSARQLRRPQPVWVSRLAQLRRKQKT